MSRDTCAAEHSFRTVDFAFVRLLSQQSSEHDLSSTRLNQLAPSGLDNALDQPSLGTAFHQQTANTGSATTPASTNSQQTTPALNVAKAIGNMGANLDRGTFRQQPPPMKVIDRTLALRSRHTLPLVDMPIMPTANPSQCTDLSDLQSEESLAQSEETQTTSCRYSFLGSARISLVCTIAVCFCT